MHKRFFLVYLYMLIEGWSVCMYSGGGGVSTRQKYLRKNLRVKEGEGAYFQRELIFGRTWYSVTFLIQFREKRSILLRTCFMDIINVDVAWI